MSRCGGIVAEFAECGKGGELINFRGGNVASQCHSLASVTRVLVYPSKPFTQLNPLSQFTAELMLTFKPKIFAFFR